MSISMGRLVTFSRLTDARCLPHAAPRVMPSREESHRSAPRRRPAYEKALEATPAPRRATSPGAAPSHDSKRI